MSGTVLSTLFTVSGFATILYDLYCCFAVFHVIELMPRDIN